MDTLNTRQIPEDPSVLDLGIGQPDLALLPQPILRAATDRLLRSPDVSWLTYGPARGHGYLVRELAGFLTAHTGVATPPEQLMITAGCSHALDLIARTLAQPGDTVLVEDPTYFLAPAIFRDAGLQVVGLPLESDGWQPEALERALETHRPRLLYTIPTHHNPTGSTLRRERRQEMVDLCRRYGVLLVADEVYHLLTYRGTVPAPMAAYVEQEHVLSLGSFSKILAPGLRLGWIQTAPSLLERLTSPGVYASGGGTTPLVGGIVYQVLHQGDQGRYLATLRQVYGQRVLCFQQAIAQHLSGLVEYQTPTGGYFFWLRLRSEEDSEALLGAARELGVSYRCGRLFSPSGRCRAALRLCFAHYDDHQLEEAIARLGRLLQRR